MSVKLLTEHHLEFLSVKGGFTGSYASTPVKMPHCWKSHVTAQIIIFTPDPAVDNFPVPVDPVPGDPRPNLKINNHDSR